MKIISLHVENLYGCYNYDLELNPDVTFVYGTNGCGKTTVLNITEAIITGRLYKLFEYDFTSMVLVYSSNASKEALNSIKIDQEKNLLSILFEKHNYKIEKVNMHDDIRNIEMDIRELYRYYFSRYEILKIIKRTFNYVYLPLNRSSVLYDYEDNSDIYMMRRVRNRIPLENNLSKISETRDIAMMQIEDLINYHFSRINSNITEINDSFRNDIMKSLLDVNQRYTADDFIKDLLLKNNKVSDFKKTNKAYIKMLKELEILNKDEEEKYNKFFAEFIEDFLKHKESDNKSISIELITKFQEVTKIKNLVSIAEKMEQRKSSARKPIELFIKTMNGFIENSEENKEILIDPMGRVGFVTKYCKNPISIQCLSSGEKQLMTFFANLIFNVKSSTSGIFVVDEPELSLHLSWQKIFVEKTLEINSNIQLIFATHSPEIIGNRRNKMFRLEKKFVGKGDEYCE